MDRLVSYALDAAKEITISRMSNTTLSICKETGEQVADFYEAIFNRILEIEKNSERN